MEALHFGQPRYSVCVQCGFEFLADCAEFNPATRALCCALTGVYLEISHITGKDNTAADALSRLERLQHMQLTDNDSWKEAYVADPKLCPKYF